MSGQRLAGCPAGEAPDTELKGLGADGLCPPSSALGHGHWDSAGRAPPGRSPHTTHNQPRQRCRLSPNLPAHRPPEVAGLWLWASSCTHVKGLLWKQPSPGAAGVWTALLFPPTWPGSRGWWGAPRPRPGRTPQSCRRSGCVHRFKGSQDPHTFFTARPSGRAPPTHLPPPRAPQESQAHAASPGRC